MKIRARFRIGLVRTIVTTLFLSLFATFPVVTSIETASATTTITKTVTIKGSNNALYNGAQAALVYYVDGDKEETFAPIQTTGSSGQVTISYPSKASYAHLFITPPLSDTTNAVETIDLLTINDAAIANVTLKASNIRVKIERPDGTNTGMYTCVDYPKLPSSRWATTQYRTTRSGAFGIAIPTTLIATRDYQIVVNPCNKEDYKFIGINYGLRRASNGTITLYTNDKFTTVATATAGIYSLKLAAGYIRGSIVDSSGNQISLSIGTYLEASAQPIFSDGTPDGDREPLWANQVTADGKFTFGAKPEPGIYEVILQFSGDNPLPNFTGGRFWVNESRNISATENGTYSSSLDQVYTIPSSGLVSFKFVNSAGSYDQNGGTLSFRPSGSDESQMYFTSNRDGIASGVLKDGVYSVQVTPKNSIELNSYFTLTIVNGVATLKNSANVTIPKVGNDFPIEIAEPTFKFRAVSPDDTTTSLVGTYVQFYSPNYDWYVDGAQVDSTTSITRVKAPVGSYVLNLDNYRSTAEYTSNSYTVDISSASVVVKKGATVITPVNGIYILPLKRPVIKGDVLNPAGTESVRWAQVRAIHTTNRNISTDAQSSASGAYALDLPIDGTYLITATPPYGVNANHGISESVTVVVTNGVANPSTLNIRLRAANISGVVTGPTGIPSVNNYLSISESRTGIYLDPTLEASTDEDGAYSLYLPTGAYGITPNSDFSNTGGVASGPKSCAIGTNPATPVTCNISLVAPNVTGVLTIGGERPSEFSVGFAPPANASPLIRDAFENKYGSMISSEWSDVSSYGVNLDAGTYRMWITYRDYDYTYNSIPGPLCVVPSTGSVTCDAVMPATNLSIQVTDWSANISRGRTQASIQIKEGNQYFYTCCSYNNRSSLDGKITAGLLPGSYKVVISEDDYLNNGMPQTYYFNVTAGGSVSNMSLVESGTVINPVNGNYLLALKEPFVTGTLYGVDGVTPEPLANVWIFSANGQTFDSTNSNRRGRFTLDIGSPLADGTYYMYATAEKSLTKGNSKVESFTVLNGKPTTALSLKLNTPNVRGVASGPLGVSPNTSVRANFPSNTALVVLRKIGGSTHTDSEGKFAFYLPAGTYTFYGNTDFGVSGGIDGTSQPCVVSGDSGTVTTCNIAFAAPTLSGTVSIGGANVTNTSILFFPAYGIAQNPATESYGWIGMSSGKYGVNATPGTYRTYLLVNRDTPSGGYMELLTPGPLCTVAESGSSVCNVTLPASNFTFRAKSATNTDLSNATGFTLEVKNGDQFQSAGPSYVSEATNISLSLPDGSYRLKLEPSTKFGSLDGTSIQYLFDVSSAQVTNLRRIDSTTVISRVSGVYNLPLNTPNVTGTVTGPKGVAARAYIEVSKLDAQGKNNGTNFWANTNTDGKFALNLPTGIYFLRVQPDFSTTGGGDTTIRCEVAAETNTATTCNIALSAPNVTGTFRVNGELPEWGSVLLQPAKGIAGNTATESYGWVDLANGAYGIYVKPGTYRVSVNVPMGKWNQSVPANLCVVPETGAVTCGANIPATNLTVRVLNSSGLEISNVRISLATANGDVSCCNYFYKGDTRLNLNLLDGLYALEVSPNGGEGGSQSYNLRIETGTVTSLRLVNSSVEIASSGGVYSLSLRPPTFTGTVYKSNGTTPAPFTQVQIIDAIGKKWSTTVESDQNGKFVIDVPQNLAISRVSISAIPNRLTYRSDVLIDKNQGSSAGIFESITAGAGNQNVVLRLRPATITGRVTGSKGALVNQWVSVQQQDGTGNWNWTDVNLYTDRLGDFAEHLPAGTYRLYSKGDFQVSGGGETYGNPCVITADSSTAVTCNLALIPPNVSGLAKNNLVNIPWGEVQFIPDQATPRDTPRRNYYAYINQGEFAVTVQPDTYQIAIWYAINGQYSRVFGPKCVVPETGTVSCNINFSGINLSYKVHDSNNVLQTSNVYSTLEIKSGNTWNQSCCSYPDANLRNGKFDSTLIDGLYRLTVRPSNSSVSGSTRMYTFAVESATVKNFAIAGTVETITPLAGIYTIMLSPAAISGTIYKSNGTAGYANARVCVRNTNSAASQKAGWRACAQTNESGKYTMEQSQITDGTWWIQAFSTGEDLLEGSSLLDSLTVTSGIGSKVANLTLRAPNVTGVVSGPRGVSPSNYINVRKFFDNGEDMWVDAYFRSDSQGRYSFTLEPGRYRLLAGNDMVVAGGTSAQSNECVVTTGNTTTCDITLVAPNVTGTVRINGEVASASVEFLKESVKGFDYGASAGTYQNGEYALKVTAGTYRPRIYLYSSGNYILGPPCVVPESGAIVCNLNLPATNLRFKINKVNGSPVTSGVSANFTLLTLDRELWAGNASADSNGVYRGSLIDGSYRVELSPSNDATIGTATTYKVTIDSGTVQSITRDASTAQLVATSGIYTLSLGTPSIAGTVVAPDGTTPVPNSRVYAFTNPYSNNQTSSDKNAAFAFAKLPDGTYSVIASPGWEDPTKAPSAPSQITITNGVGVNDLRLVLRTPNVTGVVRGPTSKVSAYNWLSVEQKMEGNYWKGPDYFTGVMTSPEGSFGLYLAPGVYRIRANGDLDQAGGVSTAVLCTVPSTGTTTCDITLKGPNLKAVVISPIGIVDTSGSYVWGYLQSAPDESAILNRNIGFQRVNNFEQHAFLEDGTWMIRTEAGNNPLYSSNQFTVVVSQGVVTRVSNANNETLTASVSGVYQLPLLGSNLRGSITFNGAAFDGSASVTALRQDGEYFNYYMNKWSSNNEFGFTLPAGNYKIEVVPYYGKSGAAVSTSRSELCVVEATGTTTCNVALKAPNLKGKVTDKLGAVARFTDAYILMQHSSGERWVRWLELRDGLFDTYLEDGTYRIQVMPRWDYRKTYTDRSYIIKVESGTVQSVTDLLSLATVTPSSGVYAFTLGTPSVSGKVFDPGTSTGSSYINIQVAPSSSPAYWRYSTQSDANGEFSLTIPNGTYIIQAIPNKGGFQFGKSETRTITIANNVLLGLDSVTLVLRQPNFVGRVVIPGTSTPLANVNVNINIDGEYAYGWTDSDGRFGAYIDDPAPRCPERCSLNLNYFKGSEYTPKYYPINAIGNIGDKAIGGVTSILTVLTPQASGPALASQYSWVSVERRNNNGSRSWVTSGSTNELGRLGLSLDTGETYTIWAYPNGEESRFFAPKKLEITNYSPETNSVLSITYAQPNVRIKVLTATNEDNRFGWFTVSTWDSATSTATQISNGSLDSKGFAALTLDNGNYQLRFWPGKGARGVQKTVTITVTGSAITATGGFTDGSTLVSPLATITLPSGNISGAILSAASEKVSSALVAAYRADDESKFFTTTSDANGNYQINLDLTYSWIIRSVDPLSGYTGSLALASRNPSNDVVASQNVTLSTAP